MLEVLQHCVGYAHGFVFSCFCVVHPVIMPILDTFKRSPDVGFTSALRLNLIRKTMFLNSLIGRTFVLCFAISLPGVGNSAEHIINDGSSVNAWKLFDASPSGASLRVVSDPIFNSEVIRFSGKGTQNAWKKNFRIDDPIVKFEMRTENRDQDFDIVFFARTNDGKRRIAKYSTRESATALPPTVLKVLPSIVKDTNAHTINFDLQGDFLGGGISYKEVYQIRIRGTGILINEISSINTENSVVLQPLLTFDQITGDDTIDSIEDDTDVKITGVSAELESGQPVLLSAQNEEYSTTVQDDQFSFVVPSTDVQKWPEVTTIVATSQNIGGLEVITKHDVSRGVETPVALENALHGNGMVNLTDRLEVDIRGLKAFPGAEGGGQDSNGGRGGVLYTVNTRDCSVQSGDGKISIREVMEARGDVPPGDRIAVFSVGGLFDCGLTSYLRVKGELTLACQTAPYPGVNIAAYRIEYKKVKNITIRGCQFFNHDYKGDNASTLRVVTSGDSSDLIFDRLNFLHTVDDITLAFVNPSTEGEIHRVTLSNSIVAESDAYSSHSKSMPASGNIDRYVHSHGASCMTNRTGRQITDCSIVGNLFAHTARRNPNFFGSSGEIIGNYLYNIQETGPYIHHRNASEVDLFVIDNVMKYGPNTKRKLNQDGFLLNLDPTTRIRMLRNQRILLDGTVVHYDNLDTIPQRPLLTRNTQFDFDCDGAKHRDSNIIRILNEVNNGTGEVGIGTFGNPLKNDGDAGRHYLNNPNYYDETQWPLGYDTDGDGMADEWELENGLAVGIQDHNNDLDNDGYTNIEEFINDKIRCDS